MRRAVNNYLGRALVLVAVLSCSSCCQSPDYQVYSDLLLPVLNRFPPELPVQIVAISETNSHDGWLSDELVKSGNIREDLIEKFPDASPEVITDYLEKNMTPVHLRSCFNLPVKVVLISEKKAKGLLNGKSPMRSFYEVYPSATGLTRFSRVGFNKSRTEALVYIERRGGEMEGSGALVYAKKSKGKWQLVQTAYSWIA